MIINMNSKPGKSPDKVYLDIDAAYISLVPLLSSCHAMMAVPENILHIFGLLWSAD
jgi:hypothetical protein